MRSNCIAVLLLMQAATGAAQDRPLPEMQPFIKEVRERLQTDRTLQTNYAYVETRRELKLDKQGRATGVSEKVFESYPGFPGEPRWERLIAEDGTPVKTVRQRGESEFTNYRKFTVDTRSSFVPPPVKP